jgi:DNA-binding GntR family transcriptional regulator
VAQPFHSISSEKKFLKSAFIIKIFKSSKRWSIEKKREKVLKKKRKENEKLQESLQIKRESQYFERRKYFNIKIFLRESIFSPSIIPFQKAFSKSFQKIL